MTADQVSKGMPGDLLSSDTCAIQPPTSVGTSVQEESSHAVDQHGQALLNTSAAMPVSGLDKIAEIQPNSSQEEERRGNVLELGLVQPSDQTVSMEASRFSMVEGVDLTNVNNNSSIQATGPKVPEDEDISLRSQPTAYFHSQAEHVCESLKADSATVEPVGSGYVVFQDVVVDDSGSPCIPDSQVWSKTISTGSPMIPDHPDDAAESFVQNFFDLQSTNQETKVPESSQDGENTPATFKAVSNTNDSMQTQDQPRARQLNRGSSAVGNIPETNFEMDWIHETFPDVMTVVDSEGQGNTVCNTERGNVVQTDPEMSGIVGETVTNISLQISGIVQATVCHIDSEISDSTEDTASNIDPEIGDIVGGVVSCISFEKNNIANEFGNIAGEMSHKTEPGKSNTTGENTYETSHSINSNVLHNITRETRSKTACSTGSEMGYIIGESIRGTDSEVSTIVGKTAHYTDCVGLTVPNVGFDVCDSKRYDLTVDSSSTNDVNLEPEIPGILEPLHQPTIEVNKPVIVCDAPVLGHPSTQAWSVELSGNNAEGDGSSALILDLAIPNPNGMPADSTSHLPGNVLTPPSKSCVLEYPVPDRITHSPPKFKLESKAFPSNDPMVANMPENNPDTHLQIPGFPHTSSESPQISEEAETDLPPQDLCHTPATVQDLDSSCKWVAGDCSEGTGARCSNQLWTDACQFLALEEDKGSIFDEWGHSPAPSPPRVSPDNTKPLATSQGSEAAIGQLVSDWELPSIESWSSSDSWASALSDWFQSVSVFTEDSPLVANTTSCSSPVDSLSLPCLPIQDTTKRQKDSPEDSAASGQMCLPLCSMEAGVDSQSSGVPKDDNSNGLVQQLAGKDLDPHTQSYTAGNKDLTEESEVTLQEKGMEVETPYVNPYAAYMPNLGSHIQEGTVAPVLPVKDYSTETTASQHICGTEDSDAVWGVAEDRTSQLSPDFKKESTRNYGSLKLSDYPSNKAPTAGCVRGPCFDTCTPQLDGHVPSELEHLTHAHGAPHSRSSTEGTWSHVSLYTKDLESGRGRDRADDPLFIMPFAPISIGTSFYHPSSKTSSKPSLIGVTNKLSRVEHTGCSPNVKPASGEESSDDQFHTCSEKSCEQTSSSSCADSEDSQGTKHKTKVQKASDISQELSKLILLSGQRFMISEKKRVAYVTLDLDDVLNFNKDTCLRCDQEVPSSLKQANCEEQLHPKDDTMPQKTPKTSSEGKTRSKHKEKMTGQQLGTPSKKQEKVRPEPQAEVENECLGSEDSTVTVIETIVITEKVTPKPQGGKKKKKPGMTKPESEPLAEVENGARPKATKAKNQGAEATPTPKPGKAKEKPVLPLISAINAGSTDSSLKATSVKQHKETEAVKAKTAKAGKTPCGQESQSTCLSSVLDDDIIKRRRISGEKTEVVPIRTRPQLPAIFRQKKEEDVAFKKAYSDVVKQKIQTHKEVVVPHVVAEIQAAPVPEDPQSISLWCQFSPVTAESSISWTKEGKILSEKKRGAGDDSRVTLSILKACSKDLGMYRCCLTSTAGSVSTSEYHLTSEVLMELVLPSHDTPAERSEVDGDEEDVHCASLHFKDDILTEQYFGENQPASIVTEKAHFGEGMHRKAFRTTLRAGMVPVFNPGHPCVLKVHNAITYGTKNNEELIQKNYNLAVEECHVQNTAREYIKAYTNIAKSTESFGEVPEIIPIYLVHRPSSDIPYATLEEELIGDFVKYSVKDGKEINLMRRDSEAGQKCCAFQHWVYSQTDGNLLVTDMQGVGMRLTDVGIATCKKGYKGFKGNCATTFIDQFKALHQCNRFCELLGLTSLQPKPKRTVAPPKPKTQPAPKKKTFGPVLKSKS